MPAAIIRALKASKPHFLDRPLQIHQARFHHIIILRPTWCQKLALARLEQQYTEPRRKDGVRFVRFLLSAPPNGNKAATSFFSLDNRSILPREYFCLLQMEEEKEKVSAENLKKISEVAKPQDEKSRLRTEQEKKRKEKREEEERNRVKEQEMEDKIGPPPEKPLAGDCCGQGCDVCVWDTYWDELDKYKKLRKAAEEESGQ